VLVCEDGRWYVVDWDDLALGDPALEFGILLGPLLAHLPPAERSMPAALPASHGLHARLEVYLRAALLDEVIDSLADYVESDFAPEHQAEVQAEKQRVHEQALKRYRSIYMD
jgi:aminoglycoside phosphotransferase (APT) family kinase protein